MSETIIEVEGHTFRFLELQGKKVLVLSDEDRDDALHWASASLVEKHRAEFNKLFTKFLAEKFTEKKELFAQLRKKYKG